MSEGSMGEQGESGGRMGVWGIMVGWMNRVSLVGRMDVWGV